jgi:hypothetical protein
MFALALRFHLIMTQAESKKNARLPDLACGEICGAVMTSATDLGL